MPDLYLSDIQRLVNAHIIDHDNIVQQLVDLIDGHYNVSQDLFRLPSQCDRPAIPDPDRPARQLETPTHPLFQGRPRFISYSTHSAPHFPKISYGTFC